MRYALAPVALAAFAAANPVPQGVTESLTPDSSAPDDCQTSYDGTFNIQITNVSDSDTKRSIHKRQSQILALSLADGVLTDSEGRTGYIAANSQFQFDAPPQTGALLTAGWAVCPDGRLYLGEDDQFESCLSGNFYNLYDENVLDTEQCTPVYINVVGGSSGGAASVMPDGQPTATPVAPASQIPDGQITASAVAPVSQIPDGQITGSAVAPVSQIPDGQIQQPTGVVSQIPDGQIQQPTGVVSQIPDGQIQQPTGVVSQIPDGQIQQPTGAVSQIPDGQIQAPTAASSGYMPTANGTMAYPSVPVQSEAGAAPLSAPQAFGLAAGFFGLFLL